MSTADDHRIGFIDALRGFSLAGVVIVHFMEQYLGNMAPAEHADYSRHMMADTVLDVLGWIFIRGKGFAVFSFMFGLSFALQMGRAAEKNPDRDFRPRFAWRLAVLFGIGMLHSLLYRGDILSIYAVLGLPLLLFYRVGGRWLWALALLLLLGTPRVVMHYATPRPAPAELQVRQLEMERQATRHWIATTQGPVSTLVKLNVTEGIPLRAEFQLGGFARGYQTFAYFLLGLWVGRRRLFEDLERHAPLFRKAAIWGGALTLAIPLGALVLAVAVGAAASGGGGQQQSIPDFASWPMILGLGLYDIWNFVMSVLYVAGFALLFREPEWTKRLLLFAPVGRMALSSYLMQTVLGALVFFGFGFGALGRVGSTAAVLLAVILFGCQAWLSRVWLERFRYGPIEWLWRSLTYLRRQPFTWPPTSRPDYSSG
jgi:uncharacterized protein